MIVGKLRRKLTLATRNVPDIYNQSVYVLFPAQPYREADVIRE